jgi:hypothetical protein
MKKLLFLFLALLLPILIYFFLKSFGRNEFEVPVLFADSVTAPVACNAYSYKAPYLITDSVLQKISWNSTDSLTIIVFDDQNKANQHERKISMTRIFDQFKTEPLKVIHIYNSTPHLEVNLNNRLDRMDVEEEEFNRLRNCVFLLSSDSDAVIIDYKKRIRGQYNLTKRDDADRMIMQEMNILFKRY